LLSFPTFRHASAPVRVHQSEEYATGTKEKTSNQRQDAKGKVKETVGSAVGNKELENKGKADQAKAGLKDAGEDG
jgi:uncharacterized protein YjbJ (UPF0337 family)